MISKRKSDVDLTTKTRKKSKSKESDNDEINRVVPHIVESAIKWQESLLNSKSLEDLIFKEKFERYFRQSSQLLEHTRAKQVSVSYSHGGKKTYHVAERVMVNGTTPKVFKRVYPGIHDRLQSTFYPEVSENPIERSKRNRELGGRKPLSKLAIRSGMKSPCKRTGSEHGTMVHNQLDRITRILNRTVDFDYYLKKKEETDHCVESFIDMCIQRGWFPLRSEFIIFDEDLEIATAIDLLMVDIRRWKLIMIEIKTGYEDEEYGIHPNDIKFYRILTDLTNCPLNRHLLQLITMDLILTKKYGVKVDEMYIIRMCPKMGIIEDYAPSEWCRMEKYRKAIYTNLLKTEKNGKSY